MARVKGRDVLLELMDSVEALQATAAEHADLLASMAEHTVSTSAEMTALAGQVAHVSRQMSHVSQRMDDIAKRTASLEADFQTLAQNSVESVKFARTLQQQLGRTAKLLGEFAGGSKNRFETIEGRLDRLERKAG